MTARTIALLALTAAVLLLAFMAGHKRGRYSLRFARRDGYREGVKAEAARWEKVTGVSFGRLQAWRTGRGPDPFASLAAATEVLPAAEVLLAEADTVLGRRPQVPGVPSVAEVDDLAAAYQAAHGGDAAWQPPQYAMDAAARYFATAPPVVADITSAAAWRPPGWDEVPVIDGRVVTPDRSPGPAGDWDRLAGRALPDYAAAALGGHRTVEECVDSIVMRAVAP